MPPLTIKTAKTKVRHDTHLHAHTFEAETGEPIVTLLRIDGREKEADRLADEWLHTIERTLVHSDEPPYERLDGALKELNGLLKGTQIAEHIREVNAIVAMEDRGGILYVAQAGRAEAYLTRGGSAEQITDTAPQRSRAQFLYISNGELQSGDSVILSSERLLRSVTLAQIAQASRKIPETLDIIRDRLETEKEMAALALLYPERRENGGQGSEIQPSPARSLSRAESRGPAGRNQWSGKATLPQYHKREFSPPARSAVKAFLPLSALSRLFGRAQPFVRKTRNACRQIIRQIGSDLQHPKRKKRAHLLLLAGAIVVFIGIWSGFQFTTVSRKSQDRTGLQTLVEKIASDIRTAENRQLMGDLESANAIINRAEQEARSVMEHESGLFRTEALDLLDRIRTKRETMNNIIRLSPQLVANLTVRNPSVSARGIIGIERGRMIVYDRQNLYSIIVNAVDEPQRLDGDNLILNGAYFKRYDTVVFLTKENRLIELIDGQPTAMKTDDPAGWLTGPDIVTYIRFLYILSPQNNQILKYERLSNRYGAPTEYNVDGDLSNALDMTIDADVYVLKQGGTVVKLFRGETRPFTIRNFPAGALDAATKIVKPSDRGSFYFLDPEGARVIVTRSDDDLGESLYLKQYVLEGEQIGTLQDLYVDPEETQLIVLDEKRVYAINLQEG